MPKAWLSSWDKESFVYDVSVDLRKVEESVRFSEVYSSLSNYKQSKSDQSHEVG